MLIWWLNQTDCEAIGDNLDGSPDYLQSQYTSRLGRAGRGRLWVDIQFGEVSVNPWPATALAKVLGDWYGGIVIREKDLTLLAHMPGIVTDMRLNRVGK